MEYRYARKRPAFESLQREKPRGGRASRKGVDVAGAVYGDFVAGAILGSALAAPYYYAPAPYY